MSIVVRSTAPYKVAARTAILLTFLAFLFTLPSALAAAHAGSNTSFGCLSGSGTCFDTFNGAKGTDLTAYNPNWVRMFGNGKAYTTGANATTVPSGLFAYYVFAPSRSETSQITVNPSTTKTSYSRDACVRISAGAPGYCLGFGNMSHKSYNNCVIEKSGLAIGNGGCGAVDATKPHTLAITASGTSQTKLMIYLDGVNTGSLTDSNQPFTVAGTGISLQGGNADASSWLDYRPGTSSGITYTAPYGCTSGSGSCFDTFAGPTGKDLAGYNSNWVQVFGTGKAYTTGASATTVGSGLYAFYLYAASKSDTSQVTVNPTTSKNSFSRDACVRISAGVSGYCLGFGDLSNNSYNNCLIEKSGQAIGNGSCGLVDATKPHTLTLTASGTSKTTLLVFLDGVNTGSLTDSNQPFTVAGSGLSLQGGNADASAWMDYRTAAAPNTLSPILPPAAPPAFSPAAGAYNSTQTVSITTASSSTTIHYTTDGSTPLISSPQYTGPISVPASITLKAVAYGVSNSPSTVSAASYDIDIPTVQSVLYTIASPYAGENTTVGLVDYTTNVSVYYCRDTTNTCTPSIAYKSPLSFTSSGYIRAQGRLTGWAPSPISSWQGTLTTMQMTTTACPPGKQYMTYAGCKIAATGGVPPYTYAWSTTAPTGLVEGLSLDTYSGQVSGTVYGQGAYPVLFTVTDATRAVVQKTINIAVNGDNTTGGCSLFPADSIWHLNVAGLPTDRSPAAPIPAVYVNSALHLVFGTNLNDGGIPFLRVPYNQANVPITTTVYQSYFTSAPFLTYAPVEGTLNAGTDSDRHVLTLQTAGGGHNCQLWEMWQGAPTSNGWTASSNAYWDLGTYNMLPQDNGSTDAAGLPILPLLWNYDEVAGGCAAGAECGVVKHPGRLTLNHTLNYHVWPATAQSGLGACYGGYEDSNRLISQSDQPTSCTTGAPMGEIYRLKSGTAAPASCTNHSQAQVLITAMRNYGLIVADNGYTGGIVATADARWNDADLACLADLHLTDFEPVDVSSKMIDLNSSQIRQ